MSNRGRVPIGRWRGAAILALLLAVGFPAASRAACGGTQTSYPANHQKGQIPPLALGDSTMLLSLPGLAAAGYQANAHGCREFFQANQLLGQLAAAHALPHMVVIALGANCCISGADIARALHVLGPRRLLVLVTPRQLGGGSGANAALEHAEARAHRGRILLLDWVRYSAGHPGWFQPDGLHLTFPGVHAFTALLAQALPYAYEPCPPDSIGHLRRAAAIQGARRVAAHRARVVARQSTTTGLALRPTTTQLGYVGAIVSGPPGTQVQLSGRPAGASAWRPLTVVRLTSNPTTLHRLYRWSCKVRTRQLLASALPPASPAQVTATVHTSSCARRIRATLPRSARVGPHLIVHLRDRWRIGSFEVTLCVTPPGARRSCRSEWIDRGKAQRSIKLLAARPGGWRIEISTPYGQHWRRLVWVSHPGGRIRLLAAGDSEMQILDDFLAQDLSPHRVGVTSDARISTGLTNSFFFDWQSHARAETAALHQDVTVIFMGANDGFAVRAPNGQMAQCCGSAWSAGYAILVAEMIRTFLQGQRGRVYWFLLPEPRPANFASVFHAVNAGIRQAASRFPGRVALIDANAFFTPGGRYRDYMTYHGQGFVIHEADGIHLSTASDTVAARLVERQLIADRVIR